MIKISSTEAFQGFDEIDIKVVDDELDGLFHSDARNDREMTYQYFLEDEKTITLKVYWDGEEVATYRFKNKGKITDVAREKLADMISSHSIRHDQSNDSIKIEHKERDTTHYLSVESHYDKKIDAKGQSDAIMFEIGDSEGIDNIITCSVEEARAFAESILKLCDEIEGS